MGGGNLPEHLADYQEAIVRLWPELTGAQFEDAMAHGIKHVRWFGKLNVMAVAEFIREHKEATKPYSPR